MPIAHVAAAGGGHAGVDKVVPDAVDGAGRIENGIEVIFLHHARKHLGRGVASQADKAHLADLSIFFNKTQCTVRLQYLVQTVFLVKGVDL